MAIAIIPSTQELDIYALLMPDNPRPVTKTHVNTYLQWLEETDARWYNPDLAAYRDALLASGNKSPDTTKQYLSTVRSRYRDAIRDNTTRDYLYALAVYELRRQQQEDNPANRKAYVDEFTTRIENAIDPKAAPVEVETVQDRTDAQQVRLTKAQANALLAAPGTATPQTLRDTAMIALMLCTGIREGELVALEVQDLRQRLSGELALHVRQGKGNKTRLIPYGELSWALAIVERWLDVAGIVEGPVFRAFWRGGRKVRDGAMTTRAVQLTLARYPVAIEGQAVTVKPHDLRRTYARRLYEEQVDVVAIQQNLGHSDLKTTLLYIGALDAEKRRAPAVYDFDLTSL